MNTTMNSNALTNIQPDNGLVAICLNSCRKMLDGIDRIRAGLVEELDGASTELRGAVHSALNEAEALAFQTPFPHLVFPALAEEKVASARQWAGRQERIRRDTRRLLLAA